MSASTTNKSPPSWDAAVRDVKREAILAAAQDVFQQHGLEGASMRMIASRVGCTTGAIYPVYRSKEHIYADLLADSLASLLSHVQAARAKAGRNAPHEAAARAFLEYYSARPYEVNLGLYAFHGLKRLGVGKELDRTLNRSLAATVRLLSPQGSEDEERLPALQEMAVFSQLIGILVLNLAGRMRLGKCQPDAVLEEFLRRHRFTAEG